MKKLSEIKRGNDIRYFKAKEGSIEFPLNLDNIKYNSHIDLKQGLYATFGEESSLPTINDLIADGSLIECKYVEEVELLLGFPKRPSYKKWQKYFADKGFNVTFEALVHNYNCWCLDSKSGFRDEENNYHLFTPCGCNSLSFTATRLDGNFDWQETYGDFFD